jgi:hypothetical protein
MSVLREQLMEETMHRLVRLRDGVVARAVEDPVVVYIVIYEVIILVFFIILLDDLIYPLFKIVKDLG